MLALIEESVLEGREQLLRRTAVIRIIRLAVSRQCDDRAVMKIVVPELVHAKATVLAVAQKPRLLLFVLADGDDRSGAGSFPGRDNELRDEMWIGFVVDIVRRVETQAVEMVLRDPVSRVAQRELAYRRRVLTVVVDRIAPIGDT